jgi:signal transduction histidine kinase
MRLSRRFGAWATASRAEPFARARLNLTILYIAIIAAVVLLLSSSFYAIHDRRVRDLGLRESESAESDSGSPSASRLVEEYLEILQRSILVADAVTIAIAGALSYFLAGRTLRPIRDSMRSQREFYANAAHDLRTPLAVMKTEAEVALRAPRQGAGEVRGILQSSLEEIDRMSAMVEEMLLLSTYGSGRNDAPGLEGSRQEEADLADLAATAVERMRSRAEAKGIGLSVFAGEPALARVDARAVERALANVLENAVKYTPKGGGVSVSLGQARTHIDLVVADTGIGIPAVDLPRVAEAFFRADAARAADGGGAGLGLAIVKKIMTEHGGSLEISSAEGQGSSVRLRFPR